MHKLFIGILSSACLLSCNDSSTVNAQGEFEQLAPKVEGAPVNAYSYYSRLSDSQILDKSYTSADYTFEISQTSYSQMFNDEIDVTQLLESLENFAELESEEEIDEFTSVAILACEYSGTITATSYSDGEEDSANLYSKNCRSAIGLIEFDLNASFEGDELEVLQGDMTISPNGGSPIAMNVAQQGSLLEYYIEYPDLGSVLMRVNLDYGSQFYYGAENTFLEIREDTEKNLEKPCELQEKILHIVNNNIIEYSVEENNYCLEGEFVTKKWRKWANQEARLKYKLTVPEEASFNNFELLLSSPNINLIPYSSDLFFSESSYGNYIFQDTLSEGEYYFDIFNNYIDQDDIYLYLESKIEGATLEFLSESLPDLQIEGEFESSGGYGINSAGNIEYQLTLDNDTPIYFNLMGTEYHNLVVLDEDLEEVHNQSNLNYTYLNAGTYIVQFGRYTGYVGDFNLSLFVDNKLSNPQLEFIKVIQEPYIEPTETQKVEVGDTIYGSWFYSGAREVDHVGNLRYSFDLSTNKNIKINLNSEVDTYLFLLDEYGNVITRNDDANDTLNSEIQINLDSGSYIIVATTYSKGSNAEFELIVSEQ